MDWCCSSCALGLPCDGDPGTIAGEVPRSMRPEGPLTERRAAEILTATWTELHGSPPPPTLARMLLAQLWLEGARGTAMFGHNWGNLAASAQWRRDRDYWRPNWFELEDLDDDATPADAAKHRKMEKLHGLMLQGKVPEAFRAYDSHQDGARAYLGLLQRDRFAPLLRAAELGDAQAFALAARDTGYCPDCDPPSMADTVRSLADGFERRQVFAGLTAPSAPAAPALPQEPPPPVVPQEPGAVPLARAQRRSRGGMAWGLGLLAVMAYGASRARG